MKKFLLTLLFLFWGAPSYAQTATAVILPNAYNQFSDLNGKPLAGGTVYMYVPTTTTPKTTWQDPYQMTANPNPITLNGSGEALIWGSGIYRQVLYDVNGNLIWDQLTGGYNCISSGGSSGSTGLASASDVQAGTSTTLTVNPAATQSAAAPQTATYSTTTTINWQSGGNAAVTLTGNITTLTLSNPTAGAQYVLLLTQGGSGSYTVTWPASIDWGAAGAPTLSTAVNKVDMIDLFVLNTSGPKYLAVAHLGF